MSKLPLSKLLGLAPAAALVPIRRLVLRLALRDCEYTLSHIEANRINDNQVERITQRRQAFLKAELRRIGGAP